MSKNVNGEKGSCRFCLGDDGGDCSMRRRGAVLEKEAKGEMDSLIFV